MINKIKEHKIKAILAICGTLLAVTAMITGTEVPAWAIKLGSILLNQ